MDLSRELSDEEICDLIGSVVSREGEYDFLARFEKAAQCGFRGVEFMFPYDAKAAVNLPTDQYRA